MISALPPKVPCSLAAAIGGPPCGQCRTCLKARTDPIYAYQWEATTELPPMPTPPIVSVPTMQPPRYAGPPGGTGTELTALFKAAKCQPCEGCVRLAAKMDKWGPAECAKDVPSLVTKIQSHEAYDKCIPALIAFARAEPSLALKLAFTDRQKALRLIVEEAIRRAFHKQTFNRYSTDTEHSIGPSEPHEYCSKHKPINRKKLVRSLFFHMWPLETDVVRSWRWNLEQLGKRRELFNGRIFVGVSLSDETADIPAVNSEILKHLGRCEVKFVDNNPDLREGATFGPFLESLDITDPNEITLICHAKGAARSQPRAHGEAVGLWCDLIWKLSCDYPDLITEQLEHFPITGPFRKTGGFDDLPDNRNWHYSGSFYWLRNSSLAGRGYASGKGYATLDKHWGSMETWPARNFAYCEAGTIFLSGGPTGDMDMYSSDYWKETVQPSFREWRENR